MKYLISTLNWLVTDIFKNKDYPYFGTIVLLTGYQVLTLLFIFDVFVYHILDMRAIIINDNRITGTLIITIIFGFNFKFYQKKLNNYNKKFKILESSKKRNLKILFISYLIFLILFIGYNSYLIRYNLKIF